jgi:hypothetical protein
MTIAHLTNNGKLAQVRAVLAKRLKFAGRDDRGELQQAIDFIDQVKESINQKELRQ